MTPERAAELIRLLQWSITGVLSKQPRPDIPPMTEDEKRECWAQRCPSGFPVDSVWGGLWVISSRGGAR